MSKRPAKPHRFQIPTRNDIAMCLRELIDGAVPGAEVADWAIEYFLYDDPRSFPKLWIGGLSVGPTDGCRHANYRQTLPVREEVDFRAWLRDLCEPDGELG